MSLTFGYKHYVPILKGKRAEFYALGSLKIRDNITPLLEAIPTATPMTIPESMSGQWPGDHPYFIDCIFFDEEDMEETMAASHPLSQCFTGVSNRGQIAIPVTGTGRSPAYQAAVRDIHAVQEYGCAIRLIADDMEDSAALQTALDALTDFIRVKRAQVDIVLDAGHLGAIGAPTWAQIYRGWLSSLPYIGDWRTLTIAGGAFPLGLSSLDRSTWNRVQRHDWTSWRHLIMRSPTLTRLPSYGDYAIASPQLPPTGRATILAQLRYALQDEFMIWKGSDVFNSPRGHHEFIDICKDLIRKPEYAGEAFSWGDHEIYAKATTPNASPGNPETWRKIGTSHHLEMVMDQIANLP